MAVAYLDTPIEYLKGVGPQRADTLKKELGIFFYCDLLTYFPFRYIDKSKIYSIKDLIDESTYVQLKVKVSDKKIVGKNKASRLIVEVQDHTGSLDLVWFNGIKWIENTIKIGETYLVFGKPSLFNGRFNIIHPEIEVFNADVFNNSPGLRPVYSTTEKLKRKGLDSKGISKLTQQLIGGLKTLPENLSNEIIAKYKWIPRIEAFKQIHFPDDFNKLKKAQERLKFEELFFIQIRLLSQLKKRKETQTGFVFQKVGQFFNDFYAKHLPFQLTEAQKRVIKEIRKDLGSGKQMNRLLQGDVGSGKTIVSLFAMLIGVDNNFQSCLMAPTEILANQHYNNIVKLVSSLPIRIEILTGSTKAAQRKKIIKDLQDGQIQIIIGTHALIEEDVQFSNLGLVIIDEQHRFGVAQRAKLWKKNNLYPHILVMTATPIPRTLAMTVYGDLDISIIDELPPGRKPIITKHFYDKDRLKVIGFMKSQIAEGRQVYVVYPMIYDSENLDLSNLMEGYEAISRDFPLPQYAIGILHGKMKAADKEAEMKRFIKGETQILVSTTVIEVGVDVPNATIMLIENAERFGLAQLHQLRGRVGRGSEKSYCILMTSYKLTSDARSRIETMLRTNDGFEIAEADLKLRGPGDLDGTQQSGIIDLKITNIAKDEKIIQLARQEAEKIMAEDYKLEQEKNTMIAQHLQKITKKTGSWALIS